MSAIAANASTPVRSKTEDRIVDFEAGRISAPFFLRCGALFIDYILLVSVPVISLMLGRFFNDEGAKLLNGKLANAGWLILLVVIISNFVIFPMFSGQSLGKMLTGLRVVKTDGTPPGVSRLLVRHLLGYPLTIATLGLGFLIALVNARGRALHDFIAGTVVIYGQKKPKAIVQAEKVSTSAAKS
jgi:uncharacterized RDD family membrane protein YckC